MPEEVNPVLRHGQVLADATGHTCSGCGRALGDGEQAVCTRPSWPDNARLPAYWTCAACYRPPGRHERFTDDRHDPG